MKTEKSVLIGRNAHSRNAYKKNWELAKADLQVILDCYNALHLPALESSTELSELIAKPDIIVFRKMTGGGAKIVGNHGMNMEIHEDHAANMVKKPTGYSELVAAIAKHNPTLQNGYGKGLPTQVVVGIPSIPLFFEINEAGELVFSAKTKSDIDEAGNIYTHTEKGKRTVEFIQGVVKLLNESGMTAQDFGIAGDNPVTSERFAEFLKNGIKEIDIVNKTFTPQTINSSLNPVFALDR